MEPINFSEFVAPDIQNKRKGVSAPPREQMFDGLKYRRTKNKKGEIIGLFYVSNKVFNDLSLETNALRHFEHPTKKELVLIGSTSDEQGKFLKRREKKEGDAVKPLEKGKTFKSEVLEAALAAAGIITISDADIKKNQFIDLQKVGENVSIKNITALQLFRLVKGEEKKVEESDKADEASTKPTPEPVATETAPKAEEVKAAPQAAGEEDW